MFPAPPWGKVKAVCGEDPLFQAPHWPLQLQPHHLSHFTLALELVVSNQIVLFHDHCALFCCFITWSCLATHFNMPANSYFQAELGWVQEMSPEALLDQRLLLCTSTAPGPPTSPKTPILLRPVPPPRWQLIFFSNQKFYSLEWVGFSSYVHTALG